MPFTYATVTLGTTNYSVYCNLEDADSYALASITADAWRDADDDTKDRALVSSTRWLDEANWLGSKTDVDQELQWPRTGITDVDPDSLPANLVFACAELATQLVADPALRTGLGTPLPRSLRAGSASIDYFRPNDVFIATFFPSQVMSLVRSWMSGSSSASSSVIVDGVCGKSKLDDDLGFQHGI